MVGSVQHGMVDGKSRCLCAVDLDESHVVAFFLLPARDLEHGASASVVIECCCVAFHADLVETMERVAKDDVAEDVVAGEQVHGGDDFDFGADAAT